MVTPADKRNIAVSAATLALIAAVLTVGLVTFANLTRDRIARNQQAWIKQHLDALVAPQSYDNDPLTDTIQVSAPQFLGTDAAVMAYRMRKAGWETWFDPSSTIMHVGGASTRQRRQEMLVRLTLSSLAFHRHHDRGFRLAVARQVLRASARFWLTRDTLRYYLARGTPQRERLAQDREVWREVLTRTSPE